MKPNTFDITIVLDQSGSMQPVREATISGFNDYIAKQKQTPGQTVYSLVKFNYSHQIQTVYTANPNPPELNYSNYIPDGQTALNDAVGSTINSIGTRLANTPEAERPSKVLLVIITDGLENDSKLFSKYQTSAMIKHQQEKYNWDVVYLGSNHNAELTANDYCIPINAASTYKHTSRGTQQMFATLNKSTNHWKALPTNKAEFTEADKTELANS